MPDLIRMLELMVVEFRLERASQEAALLLAERRAAANRRATRMLRAAAQPLAA